MPTWQPRSADSLSLAGKNAIVTGGSRGIGAEIARELAAHGANVAICFVSAQSKTAAEALALELQQMGVSAACVQEDLAVVGAGARVVQLALAGLGTDTIHILVNNAAIDPHDPTPVHQTGMELFDSCMQVNAKAPLELVGAMVPRLPPCGGRIISMQVAPNPKPVFVSNVGRPSSSVLARRPDVPFAAWASSKAALECLSRYWAMELATDYGLTSAWIMGMAQSSTGGLSESIAMGLRVAFACYAAYLYTVRDQTTRQIIFEGHNKVSKSRGRKLSFTQFLRP